MTLPEQSKNPRIGRPRSARSHQAILDATLALVAEHGVQGTHIEAIAARAGVGKTTIYRRWSSKEAIVMDALGDLTGHFWVSDTGNLRSDLFTILKEPLDMIATHPVHERLIYRLFGEAKTHPEFARMLYERVYAPRLAVMSQFIQRAQARGELHENLDPIFMASLLVGPLLYYKLVTQIMPTAGSLDDLLEQVVDAVLYGIGTPGRAGV